MKINLFINENTAPNKMGNLTEDTIDNNEDFTLILENEIDTESIENTIPTIDENQIQEENEELNIDKNNEELSTQKDENNTQDSSKIQVNNIDFLDTIKNNEIGEKKIDSVKYSLGGNLNKSIESLLEKSFIEKSDNIKDTEDFNLENDFMNDMDFTEGDLKLFKSNNLEQTDCEAQTANESELETDQREILKQIKDGINSNSTARNIQIMLKPQSLGKVNLNLKFYNNAMHINVFVENENVEDLLKQSLEQIANTLNPTGSIHIGSINISKPEKISADILNDDIEQFSKLRKIKGNNFVHKVIKSYL